MTDAAFLDADDATAVVPGFVSKAKNGLAGLAGICHERNRYALIISQPDEIILIHVSANTLADSISYIEDLHGFPRLPDKCACNEKNDNSDTEQYLAFFAE